MSIPSGWTLPSGTGAGQFDDSGWSGAVTASTAGDTLPAGSTPIWADTHPEADTEIDLFRRTFTLGPGQISSAVLNIRGNQTVTAVYVNGMAVSVASPDNTICAVPIPTNYLAPNNSNILAIEVTHNATSYAWLAYELVVT